jgi:RNA ligase
MKLASLFSSEDLAAALDAKHVTRRQHPTLPLSIYTYSRACQYEKAWSPVTIACRGLIADDVTGDVVAWPFPKFFGVQEHALGNDYAPPLPEGEPFEVYDKVDGSLGIVFHYNGRWHVASKGSFTSEQALRAQAWISTSYTDWLQRGTTYLCEIVYPENRIVVDYGDREDLVLLGAFEEDGTETPLAVAADDWTHIGSVVRTWPALPLPELLKLAEANARPDGTPTSGISTEGYVIRYASGLRAKAKLSEYVRLHKVLTGINERDIWRMAGLQRYADQPPKLVAKALGCQVGEVTAVQQGGVSPLDALLDAVPDEFDQWVKSVIARLEFQARQLDRTVTAEYAAIAHLGADRGVFARAVQRIEEPEVRACMFLLLDGKPTGLHLWRAVKPEATAPYVADDE